MIMKDTLAAFSLNAEKATWLEFGSGRINNTYMVTVDGDKTYVLQKINKYVFKEPEKVMANISAVTNYLHTHGKGECTTLRFSTTKEGLYYHIDEDGEYWRLYEYVPGIGKNAPETDDDLYQSALAFGWFQNQLASFPAETLYETIPNFHNTIDRYEQLKKTIAADPVGRVASAKAEIDFVLAREEVGGTIQRMLDAGELPLRVTHNDTKLNNVLLDEKTHKGVCVLDLDTVMPGSSLYDLGDSIRFGAPTAGEDEVDPSKVGVDLHLFEVYTKGYLEAVPSLTEKEIDMLPMGAFIMTLELVVRFLKDYLDGDLYFRVTHPEHNLVRARNQLALAYDMEKKLPEMQRIVEKLRRK